MITILHSKAYNLMTISTGLITRRDVLTMIVMFKEKSESSKKINFYWECRDYIDITTFALFEKMMFDIKYFKRIGKIAVVADDKNCVHLPFLKTKLLGIKTKLFLLADKDSAKKWIGELPKKRIS